MNGRTPSGRRGSKLGELEPGTGCFLLGKRMLSVLWWCAGAA